LYNKNNGQLIVCYSKNTNVTIQEGIKSISSYAFKLSSGIKELTFPESLETISGHSLDYMYSIQNINMGKKEGFKEGKKQTSRSGRRCAPVWRRARIGTPPKTSTSRAIIWKSSSSCRKAISAR